MESDREKAIALVNAFFDGKDIVMRDPDAGVPDWVSVNHPEYWSYLTMFCKNTDKYQVIEKPKKQLECKIGDCFYIKSNFGILLIKVKHIEDDGWFVCDEISLGKYTVSYHDASYRLDDSLDWIPIDANLYEKAVTLVKVRENAIEEISEQFNKQIKELCQEVNQNQEK